MKILSWNINGIRASKVNLKTLFDSLNSDIICLQETKITRDMLDEGTAIVDGYNSYFSFSKKRSGYSGTANFCKEGVIPSNAEEGLTGNLTSDTTQAIGHYGNQAAFSEEELKNLDAEGRTVITQHRIRRPDGVEKELVVINVYCPRFDPDRLDRFQYKMRFHAMLQTRAEALLHRGRHVIILGDLNTTHTSLDRCEDDNGESNKRPGRLWLNQMLWENGRDPDLDGDLDGEEFVTMATDLHGGMFVDTYRHLYPAKEGAFSNWCTLTNARSTNYGRRLDYILADIELTEKCLKSADILQDVEGSDHCPVTVELDCTPLPAQSCPPLCTKFMPEFSGKQQKLSMFFTKLTKEDLEIQAKKKMNMETNKYSFNDSQHVQDNSGKLVSTKRPANKEVMAKQPLKKQKTQDLKKSNSGSKQSNLMSFFKGGNSSVKTTDGKPGSRSENSSSPSLGLNAVKVKSVTVEKNATINKTKTGLTSQYFPSGSENKTAKADLPYSECDSTNMKGDNVKSGKCVPSTNVIKEKSAQTANAWKNLLGGLGPAPTCKGHNEPCVLRMVKKAGPNKGRQFYTCARGEGLKSNPEARCDFFKWVEKKKT